MYRYSDELLNRLHEIGVTSGSAVDNVKKLDCIAVKKHCFQLNTTCFQVDEQGARLFAHLRK